jgi:hypothetical protein
VATGLEAYVRRRGGVAPRDRPTMQLGERWDMWTGPVWAGPGKRFVEALHGKSQGGRAATKPRRILVHMEPPDRHIVFI